jgi:hypothetical protein
MDVYAETISFNDAIVSGLIADSDGLKLNDSDTNTITLKAPALSANYILTLPTNDGNVGQVLQTDGAGALSWADTLGNSLLSAHIDIGSASNVRSATDTSTLGDILASSTGGLVIKGTVIDNDNISASAGIALSKLAATTVNRVIESNGSGVLSPSSITSTELSELSGVTSNIQNQINGKITTGVGAIVDADISASAGIDPIKLAALTASKAVQTDTLGKLEASSVTNTELGYLSGVTSSIQTQLGNRIISGTAAIVNADISASAAISLSKLAALGNSFALVSNGSGVISASSTTSTEIGYVSGVTSAIQTQLNAKEPTLTKGNLTETTSSILTITSGTNAVIGSGTTIQVAQSSGSTAGYLSSTDWTTFNNKSTYADPLTTNGDMLYRASGTTTRLPIGTDGYVLKVTSGLPVWTASAVVTSYKTDWITTDGTTKVVTHSLGSTDVLIQLYDKTDNGIILVDDPIITDSNTVTLTSSQAPGASGWRVIIVAV